MKFNIELHSSGSRNNHKENSLDLQKIASVFCSFLKKNGHMKGVKEVYLNLTLCGNAKIKTLNREYRNKDKVTDVLSFGVHENLRPDLGPFVPNDHILELGDIFICKDVAQKQAREFMITYEMEIIHLLVHGFLHLLGFDHEISSKEELIMEEYEQNLVKKIYKTLDLLK